MIVLLIASHLVVLVMGAGVGVWLNRAAERRSRGGYVDLPVTDLRKTLGLGDPPA